jgi:hypothetical protein
MPFGSPRSGCFTGLEETFVEIRDLLIGRPACSRSARVLSSMKCGLRSSSLAPEGNTEVCRWRLGFDLAVRLVGDQRPVSDGVDLHAPGDLVSLEEGLREDVVILKVLQTDVLVAAPVTGIA